MLQLFQKEQLHQYLTKIRKLYFQLAALQQKYKLRNELADIMLSLKEESETRYKKGHISNIEYKKIIIQSSENSLQLSTLKRDLQSLKDKFSLYINEKTLVELKFSDKLFQFSSANLNFV